MNSIGSNNRESFLVKIAKSGKVRSVFALSVAGSGAHLIFDENPAEVREVYAQSPTVLPEAFVNGSAWRVGVNSIVWQDKDKQNSPPREVFNEVGERSDLAVEVLWMRRGDVWEYYLPLVPASSTLNEVPKVASIDLVLKGQTALPEKYPNYYKQYSSAAGITVKASEKVDPATLKEARKMVLKMTSFRPDIRSKLINRGAYVMLVPKGENVPVLPELAHLRGQRTADGRSYDTQIPGLSGGITTAIPENELVDPKPDRWRINTHEFAHTIMIVAFTPRELAINQSAFNTAKREGYLKDDYSQTNVLEFWAEHSRAWFDRDYGRIGGPEEILRRNPEIYNLLIEIYGPSPVLPKKS